MRSKIIFFDIDGTLIDHYKKEIPKSTVYALKELIKNNHKVAVATGKTPAFIENFLKDYEIQLDTYVALNGNYVVVNNEVIDTNYLNEVEIEKLCNYCYKNNYPFSIITQDNRYTTFKDNEAIKDYYENVTMPYPQIIEEIESYKLYQMTIMADNKIEAKLVKKFKRVKFVRMSQYGMNVVATNGTKDRGIKIVLENSNFELDDVVVFGDGLNDISMFKLAPLSIAMGNSHQRLKKVATYVTTHISEDGIKNALEKLELI